MEFISKSIIKDFMWCPLKVKYRYIDKIKIDTEKMMTGRIIHEQSDNFFNNVKIENNEIVSEVDNIFMHNFRKMQQKRLNNIVKNNLDLNEYFYPVEREAKFVNDDLKLVGVVDGIVKNFENSFSVVEIKTGRDSDVKDELMFYKLLTQSKYNVTEGIVYFVRSGHTRIINLPDDETNHFIKFIDHVRTTINNNEFEPNMFSCQWCEFNQTCKIGKEVMSHV